MTVSSANSTVRRLVLLLLVFSGVSLYAQQVGLAPVDHASKSPGYRLKTSVYRVFVNVGVTDRHGDPVHGLTKDDFIVREDGVPQKVLFFKAYNFDNGMSYTPLKFPAMPPNTFVNLPSTPERGPLYVLFYDLVNIPQKYQSVARAQLVKFIKEKPVGARFAIIVSSDGLHLVQGFTSDKEKLLAAVNPKSSRPHVPMIFLMGVNFGRGDTVTTTGRIDEIARYLAPMPGRKNLIWFSSDFPLSLINDPSSPVPHQALVKKTLNLLADEQIAVYTVDATGLPTYESYAQSGSTGGPPSSQSGGSSGSDQDAGTSEGTPGTGQSDASKANPSGADSAGNHGASILYHSYWTQDAIAKMTGGESIYSRNRLAGALEKVTEEGGSYYTLAYSPSNKDFKGHLRHIQVRLKNGRYQLAYRHGYFGTVEQASVDQGIASVMEHGAPEAYQLIFGVHVDKSAAGHGSQIYTVDYTVMAQQFEAAGDTVPHLEIAADVYDADGRLLSSTVNKVSTLGSSAKKQRAYRMEIEMEAPRTAKFMRFAVRDLGTGKMGALEIPLPLASK